MRRRFPCVEIKFFNDRDVVREGEEIYLRQNYAHSFSSLGASALPCVLETCYLRVIFHVFTRGVLDVIGIASSIIYGQPRSQTLIALMPLMHTWHHWVRALNQPDSCVSCSDAQRAISAITHFRIER